MKSFFTIAMLLSCFTLALAQPPNDECSGATTLNLSTPPACPGGGSVTNNFNGTNVNATSTVPYPSFSGCNPGGSTDAPASEVWFTFTATSNTLDVAVSGGLSTPNVVLFTGPNCAALNAIACGKAPNGSGAVAVNLNVIEGQVYYLMISGGNVNDQGAFTLSLQSSRDCAPCLGSDNLVASPPPTNGTYATGTTVQFCYTVQQWDVTGTVEWFHAIDIQFGPGWDLSTLIPTVTPPSCDGNGAWGFYNFWIGSNTGQTFGPGFAYDSQCTSAPPNPAVCTPIPLDGDPGNNWGDGGGTCAGIGTTAPPVTFCWSVTVDFGAPTGTDLSVIITPYSDGDSGGWIQTGCNSGNSNNFLASVTNCNDLDPIAIVLQNPTCPGATDGSVEISANGGILTGSWSYRVFDEFNNLVATVDATSFAAVVNNLAEGFYSVQAINALSGCTRSTTFTLVASPAPTAMPSFSPTCPGQIIQLMGATDGVGASISYFWTGPPGFGFSNLQNPTTTIEGTYTLIVTVDGCASDPVDIGVQYENFFVNAMANPTPVCANSLVTLSANGNVDTYSWTNGNTGLPVGVGQTIQVLVTEATEFIVTGQSNAGCSVMNSVMVNIFPPPVPTIVVPNASCAGVPIVIDVTGGPFNQYQWSDNSTDPPPRILNLSEGNYTYSVTVTDFNNCVGASQPVSFTVAALPDVTVSPGLPVICSGESVTLTASGANSYTWDTNESGSAITVSPTTTTTYMVTGVSSQNCQNTASVTVTVEEPDDAPVVNCGAITPNSVAFEFDATGYTVDVLTNQTGTLSGTTFTVENLTPGEEVTIEVTASSNNNCPDVSTVFSCSAQNCPVVDVVIEPVADICLDTLNSPLDTLELTLTDATDGDTLWSGPGIVDSLLGVFDPIEADTGLHEIVVLYSEGDCVYTDTIEIAVFSIPTADFMVSSDQICIGDTIIIDYIGTADTMANFNWGFNGGDADLGIGIGPHSLSWNTPGTKNITLLVEENGCPSEAFSVSVDVASPLPPPVISCANTSTTSVEFTWPDIPEATSYTVTVLTNQTGTQNNNTFTVTGLSPNETVTIEVVAETDNPCGSSSAQFSCSADPCPTFNITIDPVADICFDGANPAFDLSASVSGGQGNGTATWTGTGITDGSVGTFDPVVAGAGQHTITFTYVEGPCNESENIVINVFETPVADFSVAPNLACIDGTISVGYNGTAGPSATFTWNFNGGDAQPGVGPGPHSVSWNTAGTKTITLIVEQNNCTSTQFSQTVEIEAPLAAPVINCMTSTSSIVFSWADITGADSYMVNVLTSQTGTLSGNTFTVDGLNPGETVTIEVVAVSSGPCGNSTNTASCVGEDCPTVTIDFDAVDPICLDASAMPVTLNANVSGGMGNGTITWDGDGITNQTTGVFDPAVAGVGDHTINFTYQEGNCVYNSSLVVVVNAQPTANFTVDDLICLDQTSSVVYTGSGSTTATYDWDFDGGMANPGTGQGPHEVSWPDSGTKTISLTVIEADCASEEFTQTVQVDAPLAAPVVNCDPTNTSVTFSWADVPGATGYQIVDVTGPSGVLNGTTYEVTGLNPGDAVTIQVIAEGATACGTSMTEETCTAQNCPDFVFDIDPIADLCADAGPQNFTATVSGGVGNGTLVWEGEGITDPSGMFDPALVTPGLISLTLTYTEGVCIENTTVEFTVFAVPTADFVATGPICLTENALVTYTGTASPAATYSWDFDDGTADPGTGAGPHSLSWATSGSKTITLTVEENGCSSTVFTQIVEVDEPLMAPVVDCETTQTSITFSWPAVPGATSYSIIEISGASGTLNGTTYSVTDLMPDDVVVIQVVAVGGGACGDATSEEVTCSADSCEDITFNIAADLSYCADDAMDNLIATTNGGSGDGVFTWSGEGITDPSGVFDPAMVSPGDIMLSLNYVEGACSYDTTVTLVVHPVPTADFTVTDPICITEAATITYAGTASSAATYTWDFDGGVADSGSGQGPYTVTWTNGGIKTISLTVTENDCSSSSFTQTIQVDEPLNDPIISCTTDNTFIIFNWNEVDGATDYQVNVLSGQNGSLDGTTFTVDGLTPGDMVTIQVIAESDGACGNSMAEESCIAAVCPDVSFDVTPVSDLCADDAVQTLTANIVGGVGGGTLTWSGPGITDVSGLFAPADVIPGDISLNLEYVEGVCSYDTTIIVTVFALPTADFTATSLICNNNTSTVTYTGGAAVDATYNWDFGGGTATPGTGQGPHEVSWPSSGTQTVGLTVVENGCTSTPVMQNIQVEEPLAEPVVICAETSSTSITFSWDDVAGATAYEVAVLDGPNGMMVGNTYVLNDLTPQQSVTIQVTAVGNGPCGNSVGVGTCVAQDCPMVALTLSGTEIICDGSDAEISFNFTGDSDGPFTVIYTLNGANETSVEVSDGAMITLTGLIETTTLEVLTITDNSLPDCVFPGNSSWEVVVNEPINAGTALSPPEICASVDALVNLIDLIENAPQGGQWSETSVNPSDGNAFNPVTGQFNSQNQNAGTYTFTYQIEAPDPCPDVEVEVNVIVVPAPIADAGQDQELTCNMGMVSLGGSNTTGAVSFMWTADDDNIVITNPQSQFIDASQPGIYTLTIENAQGCIATDEVEILTNFDVPVAEVSISQISCFQADDGGIFIDNVTGGQGPYEFSLNGGPFSSQTIFIPLGPDNHSLVIQDQNGCFSELRVDLSQPAELFVELTTNLEGNDNLIRLGDSVRLQATYNQDVTLDTIIWQPDSIAMGNSSSIWVNPSNTSRYSVMIIDENGCSDSDDMTIFVRKDRPVFIPNVFSPNGDDNNETFYIQTGSHVKQVRSFLIFNRWGETLFELSTFQPNDPTSGWDGTFRGRAMNTGVYTYFAEVEFEDGVIILYEGDVTLLR